MSPKLESLLPVLQLPANACNQQRIDLAESMPPLVTKGNTKLGTTVAHFSLPPVFTCGGRSRVCEKLCYACKGTHTFPNVIERHWINHNIRLSDDFVSRVCGQVASERVKLLRIHPAGDFDSVEYIKKWREIVKRRKNTLFWAYTRSWRDPVLLKELDLLSRSENFQLWFSADKETGKPPRRKHTAIAYMAADDNDKPRWKPDLVFRVKRETKKLVIADTMVCPAERLKKFKRENGQMTKHPTCDQCRICFDPQRLAWLREFNESKRIAATEECYV